MRPPRRISSLLISLLLISGLLAGCTPTTPTTTAGSTQASTTTPATQPMATTAPATQPPATQPPATSAQIKTFDVVVVGAGAAGLAAAIEAKAAGASVALLEKQSMAGGSTILSGGIVYGTGSKIHQKAGVKDSVDDLVDYWSERAQGKNDKEFLQFVAENSGGTIDWLVEQGVQLGEPYPTGTSPIARGVSTPNRGAGIIQPLEAKAKSSGVELFLDTPATDLIQTDGKITGVKAKTKTGQELQFNAKAVVLTTGGFDHNPALIKEYASRAEGDFSFASAGNTGDGLTMAKKAGADVIGNGSVIGFRRVIGEPAYVTEICLLMWMPYLYVNKDGKRFVNETIDYPIFYEALIQQPDQISYLIFDGNTYVETLDKAVEKGSAFKADTLEDLAKAAGIDPAGLKTTVEAYNKMLASGEDKEFGKVVKDMKPIDKPAYYALKVEPTILGTMSGIRTNLDCQVLTADGKPIPGLYAAGEVANGSFYNLEYPASGTSIQMSLTFGRVAGMIAAKNK